MFAEETERIKADVARISQQRERLREVDCFVLDNSIRESTVGQLRGHTIENKWKIYEEVKKCGIKHIVVAAFSHMTRVDDQFVKELGERGEDMRTLYSFTEVTEGVKDGVLDTTSIPVGMKKMKQHGLCNPIIEIDLDDKRVDWGGRFTVENMCELLLQRIEWSLKHLSKDAKIFVNFRDFPFVMIGVPERVLAVTRYLALLPAPKRPFGLIYEEPTGNHLPNEVGAWSASVRRVMDAHDWPTGHLLVHVHEKWGLAETIQLECLSHGSDGLWASLCQEGAAIGHACSSVTLMNLIRMGNQKVQKRYNSTYLRTAAINITLATVGKPPHPRQIIYGERAIDVAFDFGGIAGGHVGEDDFDVAAFFGVDAPLRISTLASTAMILELLQNLFGDESQFTEDMATRMHKLMIEDLKSNRKEEYSSEVGIALLFDRAGGHLTVPMRDKISQTKTSEAHHEKLIKELREMWDTWDIRDDVQGDDCLQYDSFYNGFLSPYFGCFRCEDTRQAMQAIDMDADGLVDWNEFMVYIKWALRQYPRIVDIDELLSVAFNKGLIPAMRDEIVKQASASKQRWQAAQAVASITARLSMSK